MPPRIPLPTFLSSHNVATSQPVCWKRAFTSTTVTQASTVTQRRKHRDPYAIAQARARKAANLSRQEVLKKERAAALGDPIRGVETSYVRSFDDVESQVTISPSQSVQDRLEKSSRRSASATESMKLRNFMVRGREFDTALQRSRWLATPTDTAAERVPEDFTTDTTPEERRAELEDKHDRATEALQRISSLTLGSSKDRMRAIKQRCIADFGRHNTDQFLAPKATAPSNGSQLVKTPVAGPDTGSSEVQIAILTAKIRTVADFLQSRGTQDKVNKRNLRVLVHRRQKLLNYLRRKERGGPRWQNVVETLGLTDGTWKGEISI